MDTHGLLGTFPNYLMQDGTAGLGMNSGSFQSVVIRVYLETKPPRSVWDLLISFTRQFKALSPREAFLVLVGIAF